MSSSGQRRFGPVARLAPLWLGAGVVHVVALGFAKRAAPTSSAAGDGSAVPGVLVQSIVLGVGVTLLVRVAREAGVGFLRAAGMVCGGIAALVAAGAVSALFVGLIALQVGTAAEGSETEGVGLAALVLAALAAWAIGVAATPLGAAAITPSRRLLGDELVRSQWMAVAMATVSVILAFTVPCPGRLRGWPLAFAPVATSIGAAMGLLGARAASGRR